MIANFSLKKKGIIYLTRQILLTVPAKAGSGNLNPTA